MTIFRTIFLPQLGITHSPSPARSARPTRSSVPAKGQRVHTQCIPVVAQTLTPVLANTCKASTSNWRNYLPETVFLNFLGAQESIPRHRLCQPIQPDGPVRQPYSYSFPSPIDCSKIPAQFQHSRYGGQEPSRHGVVVPARQPMQRGYSIADSVSGIDSSPHSGT